MLSTGSIPLQARSFVGGQAVAVGASGGSGSSTNNGASNSASIAEQLQTQRLALTRSTQIMHVMQQAQVDARTAAALIQSNIHNGLGGNGLVVAEGVEVDPSLWQGADAPVQTDGENGRVTVTIDQTTGKAILTWDSYNVGQQTDVVYDQQGNSDWIVLNRVTDASASPSQILGTISADGSVYIINRNGIIFGGASQVNVHTLVASTLSLSNEQFMAGINNPTVITETTGNNYVMPVFGDHTTSTTSKVNDAWTPTEEAPAGVTVLEGAQLTAASGGKLLLFGTQVDNAGTLTAPDGQIIMAAGEQVWLTEDYDGIRGLEVAVSGPMPFLLRYYNVFGLMGWNSYDYSMMNYLKNTALPWMEQRAIDLDYHVANNGIITSERGNVILQSRNVEQNGAILVTTALGNRDGSIYLRAWGQGGVFSAPNYFNDEETANWSAGTVTLGTNSVTAALPDFTDTSEIEVADLATRYDPGSIHIYGKLINLESDSLVVAPAGIVEIVAAAVPIERNSGNPSQGVSQEPGSYAAYDDGSRIYIDDGAIVSVAGYLGMEVEMARNFIDVELLINELRDSPLLQDSWLYGETIVVDRRDSGVFENGPMSGVQWSDEEGAWIGTPLADATGWVGVGVTDLSELSALGGSILLKSGGDLIVREGAVLDISGGSVAYTGGWDTATRLLGADGKIYRISEAYPGTEYLSLAGSFVKSSDKWGLSETYASPLVMGKTFENGYTEGRNAGSIQIYANRGVVLDGEIQGGVVTGAYQLAGASAAAQGGVLTIGGGDNPARAWNLGEVVISDAPMKLGDDFDVNSVLDENYDRGSNTDKTTWLDSDMLNASGLGEITLYVGGDFTLESGTNLNFMPGTDFKVSTNLGNNNTVYTIGGSITSHGGSVSLINGEDTGALYLEDGAVIDVSGEWVNQWLDGDGAWAPQPNGGSVNLIGEIVEVGEGVSINVSGGGVLSAGEDYRAQLRMGDAGSVRLNGDFDAGDISALNMSGYAGGSGGSLYLATGGSVQIGGEDPGGTNVLVLDENLFTDRGFSQIEIVSGADVTIPDGVQVDLVPLGWSTAVSEYLGIASGTDLTTVMTAAVQSPEQRIERDPVSLGLGTLNAATGNLYIGEGAGLSVDTGGSVTASVIDATILGEIEALAGSISVSAAGDLTLADGATLDASGTAVLYQDQLGHTTGEVLDGGRVWLGSEGELDLQEGSLIDVSGTSALVQYLPVEGGPAIARTLTLASDGGSIALEAPYGEIAGVLEAGGGASSASNGSVTFTLLGAAGDSGGMSVQELIYNNIGNYFGDPRWDSNEPVNGDPSEWDSMDYWELALGFDWGDIVSMYFGVDAGEPVIFPIEAFYNIYNNAGSSQAFLISETAAGGLSQGEPFDLGMTDSLIEFLTNQVYYDDWLYDIQAPSTVYTMVLKPSSLSNVGTLSVTGVDGVQVGLDDVTLTTTNSINIEGTLVQGGTGTSTLNAPHVRLSGLSNESSEASSSQEGQLAINATVLDILSEAPTYVRGFSETSISADELRFVRNEYNSTATLDVEGVLTITAGKVYPSSTTQATITASDSITILGNGDDLTMPLSAGGSLTLTAPVINQSGTLLAPFGSITLDAGETLTLSEGSITSVSGAGLMVPYGTLGNNEYWLAPYTIDPESTGIAQLPEKNITLDAPVVDTQEGAVIDISGGGDLYANEFVPGIGGSHDIMALAGAYAVIPGYESPVSPDGSTDGGR